MQVEAIQPARQASGHRSRRFLLRNLSCSSGCCHCHIDVDEQLARGLRGQMRYDFLFSLWWIRHNSGWPLSALTRRGQNHVIRFRPGLCRQWRGFLEASRPGSQTRQKSLYHSGTPSLFYERDECGWTGKETIRADLFRQK